MFGQIQSGQKVPGVGSAKLPLFRSIPHVLSQTTSKTDAVINYVIWRYIDVYGKCKTAYSHFKNQSYHIFFIYLVDFSSYFYVLFELLISDRHFPYSMFQPFKCQTASCKKKRLQLCQIPFLIMFIWVCPFVSSPLCNSLSLSVN